jgi:hypothetical protein
MTAESMVTVDSLVALVTARGVFSDTTQPYAPSWKRALICDKCDIIGSICKGQGSSSGECTGIVTLHVQFMFFFSSLTVPSYCCGVPRFSCGNRDGRNQDQ